MKNKDNLPKGLENTTPFFIKSGVFVNPQNNIEGVLFNNVSSYPTKIELDIEILSDVAWEYIPQISFNLGLSSANIERLLKNHDAAKIKQGKVLNDKINSTINLISSRTTEDADDSELIDFCNKLQEKKTMVESNDFTYQREPIIYRVSIPFWRIHENAYCGHLYVGKEDFFKGILLFNRDFGRFPISVLPEHRGLIEDFHTRFVAMLKRISMSDRDFYFGCNERGGKMRHVGHFCNICIKNRRRGIARKCKRLKRKLHSISKTTRNKLNIKKSHYLVIRLKEVA